MPDAQIHPIGTTAAPAAYTIPTGAELLLKGVYAKFNGSGAAGSFVPLLRIKSDAGSVAFEIPADNTIAAGGSADATWFPHLAAAAPSTTGLGSIVRAFGTCALGDVPNVPAGGSALVAFTTVRTSDATKAAWTNTGGHTNDTLAFKKPANGWVQLMLGVSWPAGTKIDARIFSPDGFDFLHDGFDSMSGYDAAAATFDGPQLMDFTVMDFNVANADVPVSVRLTSSDAGVSAPEIVQFAVTMYPGLSV